MKKKLIRIVAIGILCLGMVACSSTNEKSDQISANNTVNQTQENSKDNLSEEEKEIDKLLRKEDEIFEEHKALWDKAFSNADKANSDNKKEDYPGFLASLIEVSKEILSEDEIKILEADLEKIKDIEKEVKELESKVN